MMGNPAKQQDGVPVIIRVIDLMLYREASWGMGEYFQCYRLHKVLECWNIGTTTEGMGK